MRIRTGLIEQLANQIAAFEGRIVVAIDGIDGSGKTTFADELAPLVVKANRSVVRASVDGFHNPKAVRYRRGKMILRVSFSTPTITTVCITFCLIRFDQGLR